MLLVGHVYGLRSETRLCQEGHLNLAYRRFCRLGLEDKVPDRSTFSKNRHDRLAQGEVLRRVFETVVERCAMQGFVGGPAAAMDGSTVAAGASRDRRASPEEVRKLWSAEGTVTRPVQAYLDQLEAQAATLRDETREGPEHKPPATISETDPQAAWSTKDGPGRFSYETNGLVDTDHRIIVDVKATPARLSQEIVAAKAMLGRSARRHGFQPSSLAADAPAGRVFLGWLAEQGIAPHVPMLDRQHQTKGRYDQSHFGYDPERNVHTCLEGHELRLRRADPARRVKSYKGDKATCGACPIRKACTDAEARTVVRHMDEEARQPARDLARTPAFAESRHKRRQVEMPFAHLRRHLGLTRLRRRVLARATEEFLLAAAAQNLKRLTKLTPA